MATQFFVSLPVKNLDKSVALFTRLGFKFNPQFTDKKAACMIVGDSSFVMLVLESFFQTFTPKKICDATQSVEVGLSISCDSREKVTEMVAKAVSGGASTPNPPQDHGYMYQHGFADLDGHQWDFTYMDMNAMPIS